MGPPSAGPLPNVRDCITMMRREYHKLLPSLYKLTVVTIVLAAVDRVLAEGLTPAEPMHAF